MTVQAKFDMAALNERWHEAAGDEVPVAWRDSGLAEPVPSWRLSCRGSSLLTASGVHGRRCLGLVWRHARGLFRIAQADQNASAGGRNHRIQFGN